MAFTNTIHDYLDLIGNKDSLVSNRTPEHLPATTLMSIRRVVFDALQRAKKPDWVELSIQQPTDLQWKLACTGSTVIIQGKVFDSNSIRMGIVDIFRLHEPLLTLEIGTKVVVNEPFIASNESGTISGFDGDSVSVLLDSGANCTVGINSIFPR